MANICKTLLRKALSTLSRSISAKSGHIICFEALLTSTLTSPNLPFSVSDRSPSGLECPNALLDMLLDRFFAGCIVHQITGTSKHYLPSSSIDFFVSLASCSSSGKKTMVTSAPSRANSMAIARPMPELSSQSVNSSLFLDPAWRREPHF
jgi:hypothetical protein